MRLDELSRRKRRAFVVQRAGFFEKIIAAADVAGNFSRVDELVGTNSTPSRFADAVGTSAARSLHVVKKKALAARCPRSGRGEKRLYEVKEVFAP